MPPRLLRGLGTRFAGPDDAIEVASYGFVGLTAEGNAAIEAMTDPSYVEKIRRWEQWIDQYLAGRIHVS